MDVEFKKVAVRQLEMMARCTRILVPSLCTMDQVADFGLPSFPCFPGVNSKVLDMGGGTERKKDRVLFISRLVPHKNVDVLIQAVSLISPQPELVIIGPGNVEPYKKVARDLGVEVTFKEVEEEQKAVELRQATMLVHSSSYEGFGLPPLEALYCGTPVIAFSTPHMRWMLEEDAYYFSSVDGLARTIGYVLENQPEACGRAERGQKRVKDYLTLEHACGRLWAHIHQVIKEHLALELRANPREWARIYDDEHRRNWAYSVDRFDPTWERHWRAQTFIDALKECGAKEILDVGCGAVYPTIFARAGFKVHAVDISPEAIRQVEAIAGKWNVSHKVAAYVGDAHSLNFGDSYFDAVVQGELWEHIPEVEKVISEGLRVLKTGGYLIATSPIGEHHYDPMHVRVFNDQSIRELVDSFLHVARVIKVEKIAEEGNDPSCYLVVLEKL